MTINQIFSKSLFPKENINIYLWLKVTATDNSLWFIKVRKFFLHLTSYVQPYENLRKFFLAHSFMNLFDKIKYHMNANIMNTQILYFVKYDL